MYKSLHWPFAVAFRPPPAFFPFLCTLEEAQEASFLKQFSLIRLHTHSCVIRRDWDLWRTITKRKQETIKTCPKNSRRSCLYYLSIPSDTIANAGRGVFYPSRSFHLHQGCCQQIWATFKPMGKKAALKGNLVNLWVTTIGMDTFFLLQYVYTSYNRETTYTLHDIALSLTELNSTRSKLYASEAG